MNLVDSDKFDNRRKIQSFFHTSRCNNPVNNSVDRSNNKRYLVTVDDFSKVKLFKYPVCKNRQICNSYKGHSSHVTNVKWQYDDRFVISTGGLEKSIIQWLFEDTQ